jgi:hypothetical protein
VKALIRGRAIDVELDGDAQQVAARLVDHGLEPRIGQALATTALKLADEETDRLRTQLVPPAAWPGTVVCCRHAMSGRASWILLRRGARTWSLNAALFD